MPIQDYAGAMGRMASAVSEPVNAFMQARQDRDVMNLRQQQMQQQQAAAQQEQIDEQSRQDMLRTYARLSAGDPQAAQYAVSQMPPQMMDGLAPEQQVEVSRRYIELALGIKPQESASVGPKIGNYNPGDYTPDSFADFVRGGGADPSKLRRYVAPAQDKVVVINGVPTMVNPRTGNRTALSTQDETNAAAAAAEAAKAGGKAAGERSAAVEKKLTDMANAGDLLDVATPMVLVATGSGAGAAYDKIASMFGYSPSGADAIAGLKIIQAQLMLSAPRMEGPQSDRDVQLYREAAASLGDPMVPRAQKMAAIRTIRSLNTKYQARNQSQPAPGQVLRFDKNGNPVK